MSSAEQAAEIQCDPAGSHYQVPHPRLYRFTSFLFDYSFRKHGEIGIHGAENLPPDGEPYLLSSTHRSFLDIPAIGRAMLQTKETSIHMMAKKELWSRKLMLGAFGGYLALNGAFAIDRGEAVSEQRRVVDHVDNLVDSGAVIAVFPEGTRKKKDFDSVELADLKVTVGLFASKFGLTIVPVGIAGTHKSERWPVELAFGEPIEVERNDFDLLNAREANSVKRSYVKPNLMPKLKEGMQHALDKAYEARMDRLE